MSDSWQIISQKESSRRSASGQFEDTIEVTFRTALGHVGHVDIPRSQYSAATAYEAVSHQAAAMDQVGSLTGSTPPVTPPALPSK